MSRVDAAGVSHVLLAPFMHVHAAHCNGWMDGWMDGWIDGWTDGRIDGWMDGRIDG